MKRASESKANKTEMLRGRVPADCKVKVLSHAEANQTTESQIVRIAVSEYLKRHSRGNAKAA